MNRHISRFNSFATLHISSVYSFDFRLFRCARRFVLCSDAHSNDTRTRTQKLIYFIHFLIRFRFDLCRLNTSLLSLVAISANAGEATSSNSLPTGAPLVNGSVGVRAVGKLTTITGVRSMTNATDATGKRSLSNATCDDILLQFVSVSHINVCPLLVAQINRKMRQRRPRLSGSRTLSALMWIRQ